MNKRDFKYIIKRVIIAVLIGIIYSLLSRFNVHALELSNYHFDSTWYFKNNSQTANWSNQTSNTTLDFNGNLTFDNYFTNNAPNRYVFFYVSSYYYNGVYNNDYNYAINNYMTNYRVRLITSSIWISCVNQDNVIICPLSTDPNIQYTGLNFSGRMYDPVAFNGEIKYFGVQLASYCDFYTSYNNQTIIDNNNQNTQQIIDSQQQIIDQQQQINDSITDSTIDTGGGAGHYFGDDEFKKEYGLSDFVLIPINFIQNITSSICNPITIPLPFTNDNFVLPCMQPILLDRFRNVIVLYQTIISGVLIFRCVMGTYHDIEKALDPEQRMEITDMFT